MKKLTKKRALYVGLLIVLLTLTVLGTLVRKLKINDQNRHVAIDYLRKINDLDHLLKERVLESHAFLLINYDPLVEVTTQLQGLCPHVTTLSEEFLFPYDAEIEAYLEEYCSLSQKTLEAVEEFKSKNSLLRNSINYFPVLVDSFSDQRHQAQALSVYTEILEYCVQPTDEAAKDMQTQLDKFSETSIRKDLKQFEALKKHAKLVIQAAADRQKLEEKIYSPSLSNSIGEIADAYTVATDHLETQSSIFKSIIVAFSAGLLIALLALLYRLQGAAESLNHLNKNLEETVESRTLALRKALSDLELQQQILAHSTKMSALGEMAGGIAHEINTPLAAISLKAESLLFTEDNSEATAKGLEEIVKIVDKLAKIIMGLRRFSREEQNAPLSVCAVSDIVEETLTLCSQKFRSHGIELKVQTQNALLIKCVPEQISQVLINLLNNSYDAVSALPEKWISIEAFSKGSEVCIRVVDSGSAIPKSIQDKLMQPFFTTKGVGQGTGIGLSISRGIVLKHMGTLEYDAASPTTAFEIRLPQVTTELAS